MLMYPHTTNHEVRNELERRRITFGKAQSRFVPYWKKTGRASSSNPAFLISYYEKPDGLFIIVLNSSDEAEEGTLAVDVNNLTLKDSPRMLLYDPLVDKEAALTSLASLPVTLEGYSMVILQVE
jgi:hypothetical protein